MLLHEIRELRTRRYPNVSDFVKDHLSMQFGDVRAMLRLPIEELGSVRLHFTRPSYQAVLEA